MLKIILYTIGGIFMASSGLNCVVGAIQGTGVLLFAGVVHFFVGLLLLGIASTRKPKMPSNIPAVKICPICGNKNSLAYRFCGSCGAGLEKNSRR